MKLVDLVNYFKNNGEYSKFIENQLLDKNSEVIEIYMRKPFSLDSDIYFFEIEKTEGMIEFFFDDIAYYNLFDFYYFLDVIEECKNKLSSEKIAEVLLAYAVRDA